MKDFLNRHYLWIIFIAGFALSLAVIAVNFSEMVSPTLFRLGLSIGLCAMVVSVVMRVCMTLHDRFHVHWCPSCQRHWCCWSKSCVRIHRRFCFRCECIESRTGQQSLTAAVRNFLKETF